MLDVLQCFSYFVTFYFLHFFLPPDSFIFNALCECLLCRRHHRWILYRPRQVALHYIMIGKLSAEKKKLSLLTLGHIFPCAKEGKRCTGACLFGYADSLINLICHLITLQNMHCCVNTLQVFRIN